MIQGRDIQDFGLVALTLDYVPETRTPRSQWEDQNHCARWLDMYVQFKDKALANTLYKGAVIDRTTAVHFLRYFLYGIVPSSDYLDYMKFVFVEIHKTVLQKRYETLEEMARSFDLKARMTATKELYELDRLLNKDLIKEDKRYGAFVSKEKPSFLENHGKLSTYLSDKKRRGKL